MDPLFNYYSVKPFMFYKEKGKASIINKLKSYSYNPNLYTNLYMNFPEFFTDKSYRTTGRKSNPSQGKPF